MAPTSTLRIASWTLALGAAIASAAASARIVRVGPDGDSPTIAGAARIAKDGDTVEIAAGTYTGDVAVWLQRKLTVRAPHGRATLLASGKHAEGKAIWVIRQGDFIVENLEFQGARVPDGNGAGIRLERGKLVIRNCRFTDNQNGILTGNDAQTELSIQHTFFSSAPVQDRPPPHLLYAGRIAELKVADSHFESGHTGHLIKTRARKSTVVRNTINDGPQGRASYELDFPNGGQVLVSGNVIGQSAHSANPVMLAYGAEGRHWPENRLQVEGNTFYGGGWRPLWAVRVWDQTFGGSLNVQILDNLIAGYGILYWGNTNQAAGNRLVPPFLLANPSANDFRLPADSMLRRLWDKVPGALP